MPSFTFRGLPSVEFLAVRELMKELKEKLPDRLAKEVVYSVLPEKVHTLTGQKELSSPYLEIHASAEMKLYEVMAIARICALVMDTEVYLPNGRMHYYPYDTRIPVGLREWFSRLWAGVVGFFNAPDFSASEM